MERIRNPNGFAGGRPRTHARSESAAERINRHGPRARRQRGNRPRPLVDFACRESPRIGVPSILRCSEIDKYPRQPTRRRGPVPQTATGPSGAMPGDERRRIECPIDRLGENNDIMARFRCSNGFGNPSKTAGHVGNACGVSCDDLPDRVCLISQTGPAAANAPSPAAPSVDVLAAVCGDGDWDRREYCQIHRSTGRDVRAI